MGTGNDFIQVEPGARKVGAEVIGVPEASAQTFPPGSIVIVGTHGFLQGAATNACVTSMWGISLESGLDLASHGAKKGRAFRFEQGRPYKAVLAGTFTDTHRGATAAVSINSAGSVCLTTGTAVSNSSAVRIQDAAPGWAVGDVNAVVIFVPLDATIQG